MRTEQVKLGETTTWFADDIEQLSPASGPDSFTNASPGDVTAVLRIERDGDTVDEVTGTACTTPTNSFYAEFLHDTEGTDIVQWFITIGAKTKPGGKVKVEVAAVIEAAA